MANIIVEATKSHPEPEAAGLQKKASTGAAMKFLADSTSLPGQSISEATSNEQYKKTTWSGWISAEATSAYGAGVGLSENKDAERAVAIGLTAGTMLAIVAGRGRIAEIIENSVQKVVPTAAKFAGEIDAMTAVTATNRPQLLTGGIPQVAMEMRSINGIAKHEWLKGSDSGLAIADGTTRAEASTEKIMSPAIIQTDMSEMPALLRNREQTVNTFMKMYNSPKWKAVDRVQAETAEAVKESTAAMPPLPGGIKPTPRVMHNYHGQEGLDWFKQNDYLKQREFEALWTPNITRVRGPVYTEGLKALGQEQKFAVGVINLRSPSSFALASVEPGKGKLNVSPKFLDGDFSELAHVTAHELTHVEQDQLVISRLADKLGLGKQITSQGTDELSTLYAAEVQITPTRAHLNRVMKIRNGESLSPSVTERADGLIESQHDLAKNFYKHQDTTHDLFTLGIMRADLNSRTGYSILKETIADAANDASKARVLQQGPLADLISRIPRYADSDEFRWLDRKASKKLDEELARALDESAAGVTSIGVKEQNIYHSWLHEEEATKVGNYFGSKISELTGTRPALIIQDN